MNKLNLVVDIDGVLTTGQFAYTADGKAHKIFGPHDADGLKAIRDEVNIFFITADERGFDISNKRITDMGYSATIVAEEDRFAYFRENFGFDNTIFIGDGIHDARLLHQCLFGIAPKSARPEAQAAANYVTPTRAAEGAVLDACLEIKRRFLDSAAITQFIDKTARYTYERIRPGYGERLPEFTSGKYFHTIYLHAGEGTVEIKSGAAVKTQTITTGQGWYATPGTSWRLLPGANCDAFHVFSEVDSQKPIISIVDENDEQTEHKLKAYDLVTNPKRVDKPWGHELWIMWSRDYHVLKLISMNAGNQSSLQIHREKLETNYLLEGKADVIDQLPIDTTKSEELMAQALSEIDLDDFKESKIGGMHWTSSPGIVHRVIAATDYVAYETSTPELDDVVRLQDDTNRESGRIRHEHQAHAI